MSTCGQVYMGRKDPPSPNPCTSFLPEALDPVCHPAYSKCPVKELGSDISPLACYSSMSFQPGTIIGLPGFIPGSDKTLLFQRHAPSREDGQRYKADLHHSPPLGEVLTWARGAESGDNCRPSLLVPHLGKAWRAQPSLH